MKPNIKINDEIVARITDYKEREQIEARILRDIESWEAEVIGKLLLQQLGTQIGDVISGGDRTDDNGRLFMWFIITKKKGEKKKKSK